MSFKMHWMLKSWHNSSLKKTVPSEKKGAKFCVKLVHTHTHTHTCTCAHIHTCTRIHTRELLGSQSLPRSHVPENRWTIAAPLRWDWNVLRRLLAVESPLHCRGTCRSSARRTPGDPPLPERLCAGRGCGGSQPGVKRGPQSWPNWPALCDCVICSAGSLTRHSLNTASPSELMMGDLRSGTYLLLTQKCQNGTHFPLCEMETCGWGLLVFWQLNPEDVLEGKSSLLGTRELGLRVT